MKIKILSWDRGHVHNYYTESQSDEYPVVEEETVKLKALITNKIPMKMLFISINLFINLRYLSLSIFYIYISNAIYILRKSP